MNLLCTLSDYSYLSKGLVLYESLVKTSTEKFVLYYLALDRKAYDTLMKLRLPSMKVIFAGNIQQFARTQRTYSANGQFAGKQIDQIDEEQSYKEYCWSLACRLVLYLMNLMDSDVTYIDSDIVFYHDIKKVYDDIGKKSIGIIPHLHVKKGHAVGAYNVALIYFRNNNPGRHCLEFWTSCVMADENNPYKQTHGTCGDQKYLELFEEKFLGEVQVIQKVATQAAPWNFRLFDFSQFSSDRQVVVYKGKSVPLVFVHFSHFAPDYENDTYSPSLRTYDESFMEVPQVRALYNRYFQMNKKVCKRYGIDTSCQK